MSCAQQGLSSRVHLCALVEEMPLQNSFTFASTGPIGFSSPGWTLSEFLGQWSLWQRVGFSPHPMHSTGLSSWGFCLICDFLHQRQQMASFLGWDSFPVCSIQATFPGSGWKHAAPFQPFLYTEAPRSHWVKA